MRNILIALIVAVVAAGTAFAVGPRVKTDTTVTFDPETIGPEPAAYLAGREARFDDIRDGLEKEIIWAYPVSRAKTPLAIVYIHGFSASKGEVRPLPDDVANSLGSNLYYTRLAGHGRTGDAMAEASVNDWVNDLAEAIEIGRRLGERVAVIATSTGGGLAAWAATEPGLLDNVVGLVLISPNFGVQAAGAGLLTLPWGEKLAELAAGKERSFEPVNADHGKYWTTSYPTKALLPMAALTALAAGADYSTVKIPALFIFSDEDQVVMPAETRAVAERWGSAIEIVEVTDTDDPFNHVVAGDILSPSTTAELTRRVTEWLEPLRQ